MKAQTQSGCVVGGKATFGGVKGGKVQKAKAKAKEEVNGQEVKEYLEKLQEIVPFMPKNKRLSKVEVISYVIDYIHELRETLGLPPCTAGDDLCSLEFAEMEAEQRVAITSTVTKSEEKGQDQESRVFSGEE